MAKIKSSQKEDRNNSNAEDGEQADIDDEENIDDLRTQMPLQEGVLKVNLGIPIIVACNKVDLLVRGDKASQLEKNLDFI